MTYDIQLKSVLNNASRVRAVRVSRLLDSPREKIFDDATSDICRKLCVPMSLVTIIAPDRQFFKSSVGLPDEAALSRGTPIEDSVCQYVVKHGDLFIIEDVRNDDFFRDHEGLRNVGAGAYLGTPLLLFNQAIGSVCAVDTKPRRWREAEIIFLRARAYTLANEVARRPSLYV